MTGASTSSKKMRSSQGCSSSQPLPTTEKLPRARSKARASSCRPSGRSSRETSGTDDEKKREIISVPLDVALAGRDKGRPLPKAMVEVTAAVVHARRAVVISGAGISCSSGIPDFRSNDGLYALVKDRYPDHFVTGKDLFSSGLFNTPETTSLFYTFIAELASSCSNATPTPTHEFINRLHSKGKLLRSYTQNIDGLERRVGLESGGRGDGYKKTTTKNVEMHGDLGRVRCVLCMADYPAEEEWMELFKQGSAPWCPACQSRKYRLTSGNGRVERSARALPIGTLRPAIVLYDENHPLGEQIGDLQVFDLYRKPDLLLIMGTSLKVHGLKRVVREFAKAVHARKGLVVFVNLTPPSKEWEDVIDVHIHGETDKWVHHVEHEWKSLRPSDWEYQTKLEVEIVRPTKGKGKGKRKGKASTDTQEPYQLPTPRPSQSPLPTPNSDVDLSSPLSSPLSDAPSLPKTAPLTPSKRRANALYTPVSDDEDVPARKRTNPPGAPVTGVPSTPGQGNLFAAPPVADHQTDQWEDVITAKSTSTSRKHVPLHTRPLPKSRTESAASVQLSTTSEKENAKPKVAAAKPSPKAYRVYKTTGSDRSKRYEATRRGTVTVY